MSEETKSLLYGIRIPSKQAEKEADRIAAAIAANIRKAAKDHAGAEFFIRLELEKS